MTTATVALPMVSRPRATKDIIQSIIIGIILTAGTYYIGLHYGWETHLNYLEVFAVFTSYVSTWLCNVQRRQNYLWGGISTAALCVLFWHQGLLGSSIQNAYLTPSLLYGWFRWKKDTDTRPVRHIKPKTIPIYIAVTVIAYIGSLFIIHSLGGQLLLLDAIVLVGSILAQFMLDNKILENWIVWFVVDAVAIVDYIHAGLYLVAFQFAFFFINAVIAYVMWLKSRKEQNASFN